MTGRASNSTACGTAATSRGNPASRMKQMAGTGRSRNFCGGRLDRRGSPMEATGNSSATAGRCASEDRGPGTSSPVLHRKAPKGRRHLPTRMALPPASDQLHKAGFRLSAGMTMGAKGRIAKPLLPDWGILYLRE
jgi:hypothetical protein